MSRFSRFGRRTTPRPYTSAAAATTAPPAPPPAGAPPLASGAALRGAAGGGGKSVPLATERIAFTMSSAVASFMMKPFAPPSMNWCTSCCAGTKSITMTLASGAVDFSVVRNE
jgi:hypothetical protein